MKYRKPSIISPGFIQVRKPFLMGLYTEGTYIRGGGAYNQRFTVDSIMTKTYA